VAYFNTLFRHSYEGTEGTTTRAGNNRLGFENKSDTPTTESYVITVKVKKVKIIPGLN
jgi:hypothetical protein